jgi:hypothetical protein
MTLAIGIFVLGFMTTFGVWRIVRDKPAGHPEAGRIVQTVRSGEMEIVLLSDTGVLEQGRDTFTVEFRSAGTLVDVGTVRASANMTMPGMVMSGGLRLARSDVPGRYLATADFGMAGAWQMTIEWNGLPGSGSVSFQGAVQ